MLQKIYSVPLKKEFGFTLIELLIVIAILGVLAAAILVAVNPLEQLARARDAGRKSTIAQFGRAVGSYYTSQSNVYPTQNVTWMTTLQTSGDLKITPTNPAGGSGYLTGCNTATALQNGYCYVTNGTDAIVYAKAESTAEFTKAACTAGQQAWEVWSSADGKAGLACTTNATTDPAVGITGLK